MTIWTDPLDRIALACGCWQDTLTGLDVDCVLTDPPYGQKTHDGNSDHAIGGRADNTVHEVLGYPPWTPADVQELVSYWAPRTLGWICCMTSTDLIPVYQQAYEAQGRYAFAPVPIISNRVRLTGDGPASCAVYLMVSRPRSKAFMSWGALPGWYKATTERGAAVIGAKPLDLMRALVRDYSRPGDIVCDPCAGGGTTLLAAAQEGRQALGSEQDPVTFERAVERLRGMGPINERGQSNLFAPEEE